MQLHCPHCRNPIQIIDDRPDEVLCPGCGSSFRVHDAPLPTTEGQIRRFGKFEVMERVGVGGFGAVYRARDTELDRIVALKVAHASLLESQHDRERFIREARAAAQLRHPGIVPVHDVIEIDGVPTIVSDFIDGVTLRDLLQVRRLTFRESTELIAHVADALDYAHSARLVHRDIKPANIMVEYREGEGLGSSTDDRRSEPSTDQSPASLASPSRPHPRPLLLDFGLALRDEAEVTMTVDGQIIGTPAYMSPEQAAGQSHKVDRRSDVYSLGVVLYELLTGEIPFRGSKVMMVHQVLREEPRAPRRINDKIPRDLETICLKAMAKSPVRRYATTRDMADDLRRYLRGEPIHARPVGSAERLWRWCKRNPALASLTAVTAALLLTTAVVATISALRLSELASRERNAAESARRSAIAARQERDLAKEARDQEANARQLAQRLQAEYALQTGYVHCERGDADRGMLWFARSLAALPENADAIEFEIRSNMALWRARMLSVRSCLAHESSVTTVAFSGDGKTLLTASYDRTARLWDAASGQPLSPPLQHPDQVESAAISSDGTTAITGCHDGKVRFWNGRSGDPIGQPIDLGSLIRSVRLSPDGVRALVKSDSGAKLIHRTTTVPRVQPIQHERVTTIAFSPDGQFVLTGGYDGTARVWDSDTGDPVGEPIGHPAGLDLVAFSLDGNLIATASDRVRLWDAQTRKPIGAPIPHHSIRDIAFRPDGQTLATAGDDRMCMVWDVATGAQVLSPLEHLEQVAHVVFSPDGKVLLTSSGGTARLWDATTGEPIAQPLQQSGVVAFCPNGETVVTGSSEGAVRIWELNIAAPAPQSLAHQGLMSAAVFSSDGKTVITASQDKTARLWVAATGEAIGALLQHEDAVQAAAFSPDGRTVATASWDSTARLWDAISGKPIGRPLEHDGAVFIVAFISRGRILLTAGNDRMIRFWDAATGEPLGDAIQTSTTVRALAVSPDGRTIATGGWDGAAHLWNAEARTAIGTRLPHEQGSKKLLSVDVVAFSPDGRTVVSGDNQGVLRFWNAATGEPLAAPPIRHEKGISAVEFSSDGRTLVTASWDHTAQIWDLISGKLRKSVQHQDAILAVAFSPDDKMILTGGADNTARLWHVDSGRPLGPIIRHAGKVPVVAFSPSGESFVTGHSTARLCSFSAISRTTGQVNRWAELATGLEMTDDGAIVVLDPRRWHERHEQLEESGGLPVNRHQCSVSHLSNQKHSEPGPFAETHLSSLPTNGRRLIHVRDGIYEVSRSNESPAKQKEEIGTLRLVERVETTPKRLPSAPAEQEPKAEEVLKRAAQMLRGDTVGALTLLETALKKEESIRRQALVLMALAMQRRASQFTNDRKSAREGYIKSAQIMRDFGRTYKDITPEERRVSAQAFYNEACAYAVEGNKEKAIASLQASVAAGFDDTAQIEMDEDLNLIRDLPEFQKLAQELKTKTGK